MRRGNPEVIPEHLLIAILEQEGGIAAPLVQHAGADPRALVASLTERIDKLPKVSGATEPGFRGECCPS